jgi:hypothetical protein
MTATAHHRERYNRIVVTPPELLQNRSLFRTLLSLNVLLSAGVAQLVEQLIRNQQVDGSSPPASSKIDLLIRPIIFCHKPVTVFWRPLMAANFVFILFPLQYS